MNQQRVNQVLCLCDSKEKRLALSLCFQEVIASLSLFLSSSLSLSLSISCSVICVPAFFSSFICKKKLRHWDLLFSLWRRPSRGFALYGPAVASTHKLGPHHLGTPLPAASSSLSFPQSSLTRFAAAPADAQANASQRNEHTQATHRAARNNPLVRKRAHSCASTWQLRLGKSPCITRRPCEWNNCCSRTGSTHSVTSH